jgi:hypothetical protein
MDWLFLELHTLALDHDRALLYLSRPGCNIALGQAQLSRTMIKRSLILQLLRKNRRADDPFDALSGPIRKRVRRQNSSATP